MRPLDVPLHSLHSPDEQPGRDQPIIHFAVLDKLVRWARAGSIWPLSFGIKCCAIEMMGTFASHHDMDRFGIMFRASPRQADLLIIAGTVTVKMAPRIRNLYEQMPSPKYVMAMGSCAISGDHYRDCYSVVPGVDQVVPVDLFVPGCPPTPQELMDGILKLQDLIKKGEV